MKLLICAFVGTLTLAGPALALDARTVDFDRMTCGQYLALTNSGKAAAMEALHIARTGEASKAALSFATGTRMTIAMAAQCSRDQSQPAARAFADADRASFD